ncbi:MAG TPA: pentapeptide repeat-containing protein, partial [Streptosporangiaceae bacterium]|nr:pentapeptide repeat-containing protein [Streptosporangiaceae bacterium]
MSPIRGLLTKAAKGTRRVGVSVNPWLLPAAAIIVVALADIAFGKVGVYLALAAIALVMAGFAAGLLSSGSARRDVKSAATPRPAQHGRAEAVTNGTRTDLSFAQLTRAKLTGADLSGADL